MWLVLVHSMVMVHVCVPSATVSTGQANDDGRAGNTSSSSCLWCFNSFLLCKLNTGLGPHQHRLACLLAGRAFLVDRSPPSRHLLLWPSQRAMRFLVIAAAATAAAVEARSASCDPVTDFPDDLTGYQYANLDYIAGVTDVAGCAAACCAKGSSCQVSASCAMPDQPPCCPCPT